MSLVDDLIEHLRRNDDEADAAALALGEFLAAGRPVGARAKRSAGNAKSVGTPGEAPGEDAWEFALWRLASFLAEEEHPRPGAVWALGKSRDDRVADVLAKVLRQNLADVAREPIARQALVSLSTLPNPPLADIQLAAAEGSGVVRETAEDFLASWLPHPVSDDTEAAASTASDTRVTEAHTWEDTEPIAKALTTRPFVSTEGVVTQFSRDALDDMAEQVRLGFVLMSIEHLSFLPPVGRWRSAEVVTADDGAAELLLRGKWFRTLAPAGPDPNPWLSLPSDRPLAQRHGSIAAVEIEPRNFDHSVFEAERKRAPVHVEEQSRWSVLPPLEWVLTIPVVWGLARFTGGFLDEAGAEVARATVDWIARLAGAAKDPGRDRIITLEFELPAEQPTGPRIYAFIPIRADGDITAETLPALEAATPIAELAGAQADLGVLGDLRLAAFIWKDAAWHLAWYVMGDDSVRITGWFRANEPDPARFLGRPLLEEEPAAIKQVRPRPPARRSHRRRRKR
jgi:hypothetical protein